jgi:twinkle protein
MLKHSDTAAFETRGLDAAIADEMGCTFRNGNFRFEYRSQDAVSFTKVRTQDKRFWIEPSGSPLHLWNIDSLRGLSSRPRLALTLTEGEFDSIAVNQACGGYVVSVPNGANGHKSEGAIYPGKDTGFQYLWGQNSKLIPELDQFDKIVLATDADEKGYLLRDELTLRIGRTRCWFVEYPAGCKDANDVLRDYGAETLAKVIDGAQPICPGHLVKPSGLPPREAIPTYSTGWGEFDRRVMLARPELLVLTGIPGHGKGQWMRALSFRLAKAHGWRTAFLTPEDPHERLTRDMKRFHKAHFQEGSSREWMDAHFRISHPPEDERITLGMVMAEMETAALHHDCQVFVLDPWNEVSHDRGKRTDTEYVEEALVDLKRKARWLRMVMVIVAHPKKIESGKPQLYDISGSANWYNKCDHGIIVYRSTPEDGSVQIIVEKCKDHETMGAPGTAWMTFNRATADYTVDDGGN